MRENLDHINFPVLIDQRNIASELAISDIHANKDKLLDLLFKYKLIDRKGTWLDTKKRIVFCGDYLDGGRQGIEVLSYIYSLSLDKVALAILGNHDCLNLAIMNMEILKAIYGLRKVDSYNLNFWRTEFLHNGGDENVIKILVEYYRAGNKLVEWFQGLPLVIKTTQDGVLYQHSDCFYDHAKKFNTQSMERFHRHLAKDFNEINLIRTAYSFYNAWVQLTDNRRWEGAKPKDVVDYKELVEVRSIVHGHTPQSYQVSWNKQFGIYNIHDYFKAGKLWLNPYYPNFD